MARGQARKGTGDLQDKRSELQQTWGKCDPHHLTIAEGAFVADGAIAWNSDVLWDGKAAKVVRIKESGVRCVRPHLLGGHGRQIALVKNDLIECRPTPQRALQTLAALRKNICVLAAPDKREDHVRDAGRWHNGSRPRHSGGSRRFGEQQKIETPKSRCGTLG